MANTTQQPLFDTFQAISPDEAGPISGILDSSKQIASAVEQAAKQIGDLRGSSSSETSGGVGSTVAAAVSKVFISGLGVMPLITGLLGLFGGGESPEPPPLVKYSLPERIYFQEASTGSGISEVDYDQTGTARLYSGAQAGSSAAAAAGGPRGGTAPSLPAPQINVTVQTMDARSFLDHSTEIAQAVRHAMLSLNSINDVVNEL